MSSNPPLSLAISKSSYPPSQTLSPSIAQSGPSFVADNHAQRRTGGSGSFGAGATSRIQSSAKNTQPLRKQHKGQRRPRLADEDAAAESVAMQSSNSRKGRTSITHLMNFALPPRPQNRHLSQFGRNTRKTPTWGLGSGYHAADKAKYVHANYRFIVNPKGDYRPQAIDADVHLDWDNVLQILVSAQSQSTNCPICLSNPAAPRMAKCGHIFCLPCLIRYMHSSDEAAPAPEKKPRWKKCPICWDSVYISETRPVRWFIGQEGERPQEGEDVVLRLIMRQPGSTLALPRDGAEGLGKEDEIPWYFAAEVMDYARVMKGSESYMREQYDKEVKELQQQEKEDELMFGEETQWTRKAVSAILQAKEKVSGLGNPPSTPQQPVERKARRPLIEYHDHVPDQYLQQHATKSGQSLSRSAADMQIPEHESSVDQSGTSVSSSPNDTASRTTASTQSSPPIRSNSKSVSAEVGKPLLSRPRGGSNSFPKHAHSDLPYYFYEALLHYYLSPLDIRILRAAFGDFATFPSTILPRVERVSTGHIVDDELRRRAKYLAHLPQGCEVGFLECDWTDVVTPEVLEGFVLEIERRRKKNWEKGVREEKERARAEKEEDEKRWAAARRRRLTDLQDSISDADFQSLPETSTLTSDFPAASSSPPWASSRTQGGSSFASLASPSTSPVAPRTVWGTRIAVPASPAIPDALDEHKTVENDGWLQDWGKDLQGEDDLIAEVEASTLESRSLEQGSTSVKSKKKKGKKITLMSTNARRGA